MLVEFKNGLSLLSLGRFDELSILPVADFDLAISSDQAAEAIRELVDELAFIEGLLAVSVFEDALANGCPLLFIQRCLSRVSQILILIVRHQRQLQIRVEFLRVELKEVTFFLKSLHDSLGAHFKVGRKDVLEILESLEARIFELID